MTEGLLYTRPDGELSILAEKSLDWIQCQCCRSIMMREGYNRWYDWAYCLNAGCPQYSVLVAVK